MRLICLAAAAALGAVFRLHLYGKEKADRWLAETARAMGERDGAAARKEAEE
jgi:hypothetical protein